MRFVLSLAALLLVLYLVMQLGNRQLQALRHDAGVSAASTAPAALGTPRDAARQAARRVTDALQQGATARASDAEP